MKHLAKIQIEFVRIAKDDLSGTVHKEREKRITLEELPPEVKDVKPTLIKQGMLRDVRDDAKNKSVAYVRVRMKQEPGKDEKYILSAKHLPLQQEVEIEISKEMFDCFFPDNVYKSQIKHRYCLPSGWDVDVVDGTDEIYAEHEHDKLEDVSVPEHWKVK